MFPDTPISISIYSLTYIRFMGIFVRYRYFIAVCTQINATYYHDR